MSDFFFLYFIALKSDNHRFDLSVQKNAFTRVRARHLCVSTVHYRPF